MGDWVNSLRIEELLYFFNLGIVFIFVKTVQQCEKRKSIKSEKTEATW